MAASALSARISSIQSPWCVESFFVAGNSNSHPVHLPVVQDFLGRALRMTESLAPLSNKQTVDIRPRVPTRVQGNSKSDTIKDPDYQYSGFVRTDSHLHNKSACLPGQRRWGKRFENGDLPGRGSGNRERRPAPAAGAIKSSRRRPYTGLQPIRAAWTSRSSIGNPSSSRIR